ncbi:hypothetical protein FKW77_009853 [Venturia effusa]|uniref:Uncharacterized protein n=1 Tax=Venturia effusa TaxID=50376 RepID=A0A517L676_9PEZI|nr:hypothetical protein FKW77_009853 [Venturia effusa]
MKFSLVALTALPLLATASPINKRETPMTVLAQRPNFNHGSAGSTGNCASVDYKRCVAKVTDSAYSFPAAPKKQWYQCWAASGGKAATCYVWDGAF